MEHSAAVAKLRKLKRELGAALRPKGARPRKPGRRTGRPRTGADIALLAGVGAITIALPFVVYVRTAVEMYARGAPSWLAILTGSLLTVGVVSVYAFWLTRRLSGGVRFRAVTTWVAAPIVGAWCAFTLLHLASANAKSDLVRSHYTSLHPVLRAALATVILLDADLVVTDAAREPQDYARMGLPVNERTRHYRQGDGWVHAVDLRTIGRSELENRAVQLYFWSMGFSTLRHVGTADHLHVQLRRRD